MSNDSTPNQPKELGGCTLTVGVLDTNPKLVRINASWENEPHHLSLDVTPEQAHETALALLEAARDAQAVTPKMH